MSKIHFYKMHGAGNDFILIDNSAGDFKGSETNLFSNLCLPHIGIGADGLMLLERSNQADFELKYFNADGHAAEMCGNGARCAVHLANYLGMSPQKCSFEINGEVYFAELVDKKSVRLQMHPPEFLLSNANSDMSRGFTQAMWLKIGVPHLVIETELPLEELDVVHWGRHYRNHPNFKPSGTNVNFIHPLGPNQIQARVYERGVENETLACGSGAVACAIFANQNYEWKSPVSIQFPGGILQVEFEPDYEKIYLIGPVQQVFEGDFEVSYFDDLA